MIVPAWALDVAISLGKMLLEYAQKNWVGPPKTILLEEHPGVPCTIDCKKRGDEAPTVKP